MNHLKAIFKTGAGKNLPYETWETHFGGYRRIALILSEPYVPVKENNRLIDFLLKKLYKIYSLHLPELGQTDRVTGSLKSFCSNIGKFRSFISKTEKSLPIVAFVSSIASLPFLHYYFDVLPPIKLIVIMSPILDFTAYPFKQSLCFKSKIKIDINDFIKTNSEAESLNIKKSAKKNYYISAKMVKKIRKIFKTYPKSFEAQLVDVHIGIFIGDDDKLINRTKIDKLKDVMQKGSLTLYTYPRTKHLILYDHKWKNVLDNLDSFLETHDSILASE